ncbi:MAG: septum formation initiator family protein [Deltaproteobacteria bacterium]|nr:septum formation initiator family protein [Deltaproteobacteria bacterium]
MRTRLLVSASIVTAAVIVVWVLFSSNGKPRVEAMQIEEARLSSDVEALHAENDKLRHEATLLRGDDPGSKAHLEKVAREELGYIGEGERLLLIEDSND